MNEREQILIIENDMLKRDCERLNYINDQLQENIKILKEVIDRLTNKKELKKNENN